MATVTAAHIVLDDNGVAWIDDTNVKVIEVVMDKMAHGSTAEEMCVQYPHLSLAQVYSALAYYHDHQADLDARIQASYAAYEAARAQNLDSPGRRKLRGKGLL